MKRMNIRWQLAFYDLFILAAVDALMLVFSGPSISAQRVTTEFAIALVCIFAARLLGNVYGQIWRYGGIQCYIRLIVTDTVAFVLTLLVERSLLTVHISFARMMAIACMNLLGALTMRMFYRYAFKCGNDSTALGRVLLTVLKLFAGSKIAGERSLDATRINVAIIGAGRVGVSLAEELLSNAASAYIPRCFVDVNKAKVGRDIHGIPVLHEDESILGRLKQMEIQEVVFAIPGLADERQKELYETYQRAGYKIKVYDYPTMQTAGGKRHVREFDIEELLFRKPIVVDDARTSAYYRDKVILITGGGGSIGSELCRQLAKMQPRQIIILDIYENGAYDVQQELMMAYGGKLDVRIEIMSITHKQALAKVFRAYHPQVVINAAAHKHVPLMEHNCVEAVQNNVFGTRNVIELCEEYGAERFMMVSTDKAVNPTNVMGATKRMCEMLVQSASTHGKVKYSATRFGNVLGSAGSVIPLFKRQIANGGPVTITDKRIIRYFMTIPEASQLVLASGAMANNGELFVLDMGQPVRILDLAESMIRLSGVQGIEIVETGLRPGEKLYEELLVKTEELDKTDNSLIFIERDTPLSAEDIDARMEKLRQACDTEDDDRVRETLREVVPTFRRPEEVNVYAEEATEMKKPAGTGFGFRLRLRGTCGMYIRKDDINPFENRIWLASPTMHGDELKYMMEAYETNWMSTVGANINEVERIAAEKAEVKYAVALSCCTAALHLAVKFAGERLYGKPAIGHGAVEGRRVFCSDMTFDATLNPVVYEGGIPVFIDTERDTWNMDPVALEKAFEIYPEVKLVVAAHLYGFPGKVDELMAVCRKHGALLIEDAAESMGATYKGKQTGGFGDYAAISFNGNKIITGSSGGCLLTNELEVANKARKWSTQARENAAWYQHEEVGYNYRMSNVIAGVVRGQYPYLEEHIAQKKAIWERYKEGLKGLPVQMNPFEEDKAVPNYWLSAMIIDKEAMCKQVRDDTQALYVPEHGKSCPTEILEAIASIKAEGRPIWKPMHMQPMYRMNSFITVAGEGRAKTNAYIAGGVEDVGADIFARGLCLPSDNKMTADEQERIIEVIRRCFE